MNSRHEHGQVRTRIAPSPTGLFHIGNVRSALFNELFARKNGGAFVLRIEDTDKERSKKEFEEDIIKGLEWLNIQYDEFYRQSERIEIYQKYLQKLLNEDKAFWCFHTKEELEEEKERQIKNKEAPRHICKTQNSKLKTQNDKNGIIRLRGSDKLIKFNDLIRGNIEISGDVLGDVSIAKNETEPLYNFAAVVDDHEMKISHVIRGEDHISNTPKQILIYEALGFSPPFFGHLPLILGPDKSKLSKRHGAVSLQTYKKEGYLPEALINFMALLGWNPGNDKEIFSKAELVENFSLEKVQKGGAVFNIEKLNWFNKEYIKEMPEKKLSSALREFLPTEWGRAADKNPEFFKKFITLEKDRLSKFSEIKEDARFFFEPPVYPKKMLLWTGETEENTNQHLDSLYNLLSDISPADYASDSIKKAVWSYAEKKGKGNVLWPLRVALSGQERSPDPFSIAEVLGKEETLKRIKNAKIINTGGLFFIYCLACVLFIFCIFCIPGFSQIAFSQNTEKTSELQQKINERNQEMAEIQKEIDRYEDEINKTLKETVTLKKLIGSLQKTADKLQAQIRLTEKQISAAVFVIEKLSLQVNEKDLQITNKKNVLADIIREMDEDETRSLVEILLTHDNLSDFFDQLERMKYFQKDINFNLEELVALKKDLETQQKEKESEKSNLESLYGKSTDQKKIADANKKQKDALLRQTKEKESAYRKLLAERLEKQETLEKEISEFEEQLRMEIDPGSLPPAGSGVLAWPVSDVFITQYFGNTPFATQNPQVYNGMGHNGVDFRASVGTPIKSAKSGMVIGIGDTDKQCSGVSYGKWVLIKHNNNLTTLYAHLSLVKVSEGQNVALGEIVGYAGTSGYVTGPHLHFGVFAGQAVQISTIKSKICGTDMRLPVAPRNGYLNPLSYL